jgi:hypothetical protein
MIKDLYPKKRRANNPDSGLLPKIGKRMGDTMEYQEERKVWNDST